MTDKKTIDRDLSRLTPGEILYLWRKRKPSRSGRVFGRNGSSFSMAEAATELGVSPGEYSRGELDEAPLAGITLPTIEPTLPELCLIARRRSGLTLTDVERLLHVSRPILHRMEREGNSRVVQLWTARGFAFSCLLQSEPVI